MVIAIFGESCTGKSTLAALLKERLGAEVFTGKDYLRLAKDEPSAKKLFQAKLAAAMADGNIVYVISEREHLALVPEGAEEGSAVLWMEAGRSVLAGTEGGERIWVSLPPEDILLLRE